jgi:hypothetical protein
VYEHGGAATRTSTGSESCVKGGDHLHVAVAVKVHDHDDDHVDVNKHSAC